jgi:hypothetical protein
MERAGECATGKEMTREHYNSTLRAAHRFRLLMPLDCHRRCPRRPASLPPLRFSTQGTRSIVVAGCRGGPGGCDVSEDAAIGGDGTGTPRGWGDVVVGDDKLGVSVDGAGTGTDDEPAHPARSAPTIVTRTGRAVTSDEDSPVPLPAPCHATEPGDGRGKRPLRRTLLYDATRRSRLTIFRAWASASASPSHRIMGRSGRTPGTATALAKGSFAAWFEDA